MVRIGREAKGGNASCHGAGNEKKGEPVFAQARFCPLRLVRGEVNL
jgi:hypothetical protein